MFRARAEAAIILNGVSAKLFSDTSIAPVLSVDEVAQFYPRFGAWYDGLPEPLSPFKAALPSHLKLQ